MIFQDPFASLNPAHEVGDIVARAVTLHNPSLSGEALRGRVRELMTLVGLTPPEDFMSKHPSQLSGGQRQRIVIGRARSPSSRKSSSPTSRRRCSTSPSASTS